MRGVMQFEHTAWVEEVLCCCECGVDTAFKCEERFAFGVNAAQHGVKSA